MLNKCLTATVFSANDIDTVLVQIKYKKTDRLEVINTTSKMCRQQNHTTTLTKQITHPWLHWHTSMMEFFLYNKTVRIKWFVSQLVWRVRGRLQTVWWYYFVSNMTISTTAFIASLTLRIWYGQYDFLQSLWWIWILHSCYFVNYSSCVVKSYM